jgi:DNA polymerase-3 subunit delta
LKLNAQKTAAFLKTPDPAVRAVLVYGTNQGLIHERAQFIAKTIVEDLNDPFRVSDLTGGEIKTSPGRLIDEATAQSLTGGKRLVWVRLGGEDVSKALLRCLEHKTENSLIILEANELTPRSPVRKLIENSRVGAAIACYPDDFSALNSLVDTVFQENKKAIDPDAKSYLISNLGSDRMVAKSELNKLIIYMGNQKTAALDDVVLAVGDSGALSINEIIYAAASGKQSLLEKSLARAFVEGTPPVLLVRAALRHFQKLHLALSYVQLGQPSKQAIKFIKPPIMFLFVEQFQQQLEVLSKNKVEQVLASLTKAEISCKSTGLPAEAICGRVLISVAQTTKQPRHIRKK